VYFQEAGVLKQVGFCRVTSDLSTFAYLADVFILEEYRGQGLSKLLVETVLQHPDLQGLRRWILATADAHGLYAQYGFTPLDKPENFMQIRLQNPYNL
jgi:GNAT superfamily N-acetyltransferase